MTSRILWWSLFRTTYRHSDWLINAMTAPNKQFPVRICCWEDVSLTCAEQLLKACGDTERLQGELVALLGTGDVFSEDKRSLIELDLFTYAIIFCAKKSFSPKQLSAFFTIVKSVHAMCVSTPFDNLQETFAYFRELLLRHSVVRPPFSMCLYSMNEVKEITDYVLSTYFKHFKLYKHAFTARVSLNLRLSYSGEKEEEEEKERVSSKSDLPAGEEKKNGQDVDEEGMLACVWSF